MTPDSTQPGALRRRLAWAHGVGGIALAEVRQSPIQSALTVVAIALAVLAVTLLASTGVGVVETGNQQFAQADRDLWITDGGVELSGSGLENPLLDAHQVAATAEAHDGVETAAPLAFHAVYVTPDGGDPTVVTGVGLPNTHGELTLAAGDGFSQGDVHYANGSYDGPRTDEVILDRTTANNLNLTVGETVTLSPTRGGAGREVTVVGISSTYAEFLGTPTVAMPLSELQQLTGTAGGDRATFVTVTVADEANQRNVQRDLAAEFPNYEVRTNREQFRTMLQSRALLLASAGSIVVLAVCIGGALTLNALLLSVAQRQEALAALHALGLSRRTLLGTVVARCLILGGSGTLLGLAATPVCGAALNVIAARLVGFSGLVQVTPGVYALGGAVAAGITLLGSFAVGWYTATTVDFTALS